MAGGTHFARGPLTFVVAIATIVAGLATPVAVAAPPPVSPTASVAPAGTTPVRTSVRACSSGRQDPRANVECGAALVEQWLRTRGQEGVVARTVFVEPGRVEVWRSSTTGSLCGFSSLAAQPSGLHHCDRTTFVDLAVDGDLLRTRLTAFTVLAHESAHGVQERRGKDPVVAYWTGDDAGLLALEQQADCWAGAALKWAIGRGYFDAAQWLQAREFMRALGKSASSVHGAGAAREHQLVRGYTGGPQACGLR